MFKKILKINRKGGLTFIELIVVIGIFATLSGVILFNSGSFTSNITLQNLANQIALQLKKAQTNSISGANSLLFSVPYKPSYGIYFDTTLVQNQKQFDYFGDFNNNGQKDGSICNPLAECQDRITIQTGDRISNLYAGCNVDTLHITFKRPFPDASFFANNLLVAPSVSKVGIGIISANGNIAKTIIVWKTGQIEVKNGSTTYNGFTSQSCI